MKKSNKKIKHINTLPDKQKKPQLSKLPDYPTPLQKQPKIPSFSSFFSALKIPLAVISFLLNLLAAYLFFVPELIPSINMPQNTEFPFEIIFTITNSGRFEIFDIDCKLEEFRYSSSLKRGDPLTMYTHDPTGKLAVPKQTNIKTIKPKHSESIKLGKMFGLITDRAETASFSLTIKYSGRYFPIKRFSERRHYEMFRTITGVYSWEEKSE